MQNDRSHNNGEEAPTSVLPLTSAALQQQYWALRDATRFDEGRLAALTQLVLAAHNQVWSGTVKAEARFSKPSSAVASPSTNNDGDVVHSRVSLSTELTSVARHVAVERLSRGLEEYFHNPDEPELFSCGNSGAVIVPSQSGSGFPRRHALLAPAFGCAGLGKSGTEIAPVSAASPSSLSLSNVLPSPLLRVARVTW